LSREQILERVPYTYPTILKLIKAGQFPAPRKVGDSNRPTWVEAEIDEFITNLPHRD
jgi:predicted DNA-binding transcriptional regulator AlpA